MNSKYSLILCGMLLLPASLLADIHTDLVAHWNLSDGEGTQAKDSVGGNHGTLMGDATWTEGIIGGGVLLGGDGDYVDCGSAEVYNLPDAMTLAAWVLPTTDITLPDWSGIIMRGGPNIDTYALYYNLASQQIGFKTTGTTGAWMAGTGAILFDGEWHHTAAVYDGAQKTIYLDAESAVTVADSGSIESSDGRRLLGAGRDLDPPTHGLAGKMDDARIYSRGLSVEDLRELLTVQDAPPRCSSHPRTGKPGRRCPPAGNPELGTWRLCGNPRRLSGHRLDRRQQCRHDQSPGCPRQRRPSGHQLHARATRLRPNLLLAGR